MLADCLVQLAPPRSDAVGTVGPTSHATSAVAAESTR
jgi:hypothetical protein